MPQEHHEELTNIFKALLDFSFFQRVQSLAFGGQKAPEGGIFAVAGATGRTLTGPRRADFSLNPMGLNLTRISATKP